MSEFDYKAYLNQRYGDWNQSSHKNKMQAVSEAREDKARKIAEAMPRLHEDMLRHKNSVTGKMGLSRDSYSAAAVNLGLRAIQGAGRFMGNVVSMPGSIASEYLTSALQDESLELYNKFHSGQATAEEKERLFALDPETRSSHYGRVQSALDARRDARSIRKFFEFDESNIYDQDRDRLISKLSKNYENYKQAGLEGNPESGAMGLVASSLWDMLSNPSASLGLAAENAANILAAAYTGGASLLAEMPSEVSRQTTDFLDNHIKENQGAVPTKGQLDESRLWSVAGASLDAAGDRFIAGLSKAALAPTKAVKGATKAAKEASEETAKNVSRLRKLANFAGDNMATRTGKAYLGGFASEFPIGAAQGYTEAKAQLEDPTGEDIYLSGMLEGMGGGGMTGGVRGVAEVIGAPMRRAATKEAQRRAEIAKKEEAIAKRAERVRTGNVDDIADSTHADYDPKEAVSVLMESNKQEGITPEQKKANDEKIDKIFTEVNVAAASKAVQSKLMQMPKEDFEASYDRMMAAKTKAESENDTATLNKIKASESAYEAVKKAHAELSPEDFQSKLSSVQDELIGLGDALQKISDLIDSTTEEEQSQSVSQAVETLTTPATSPTEPTEVNSTSSKTTEGTQEEEGTMKFYGAPELRFKAAKTLATTAITNPEALSQEDITKVREALKTSEDIPQELKDIFEQGIQLLEERQKTVAEHQATVENSKQTAQKNMSRTVLEALSIGQGDGRRKGVDQYETAIKQGIATGNYNQAIDALNGLQAFALQQRSKADAFQEALRQSQENKKTMHISKDENMNWVVREGKRTQGDEGALDAMANSAASRQLGSTMSGLADHLDNTANTLASALEIAQNPDIGLDSTATRKPKAFDFSTRDSQLEAYEIFDNVSTDLTGEYVDLPQGMQNILNKAREESNQEASLKKRGLQGLRDKLRGAIKKPTKPSTSSTATSSNTATTSPKTSTATSTSKQKSQEIPEGKTKGYVNIGKDSVESVYDSPDVDSPTYKSLLSRTTSTFPRAQEKHVANKIAMARELKVGDRSLVEHILDVAIKGDGDRPLYGKKLTQAVMKATGINSLRESDNAAKANQMDFLVNQVAVAYGMPWPPATSAKELNAWREANKDVDVKSYINAVEQGSDVTIPKQTTSTSTSTTTAKEGNSSTTTTTPPKTSTPSKQLNNRGAIVFEGNEVETIDYQVGLNQLDDATDQKIRANVDAYNKLAKKNKVAPYNYENIKPKVAFAENVMIPDPEDRSGENQVSLRDLVLRTLLNMTNDSAMWGTELSSRINTTLKNAGVMSINESVGSDKEAADVDYSGKYFNQLNRTISAISIAYGIPAVLGTGKNTVNRAALGAWIKANHGKSVEQYLSEFTTAPKSSETGKDTKTTKPTTQEPPKETPTKEGDTGQGDNQDTSPPDIPPSLSDEELAAYDDLHKQGLIDDSEVIGESHLPPPSTNETSDREIRSKYFREADEEGTVTPIFSNGRIEEDIDSEDNAITNRETKIGLSKKNQEPKKEKEKKSKEKPSLQDDPNVPDFKKQLESIRDMVAKADNEESDDTKQIPPTAYLGIFKASNTTKEDTPYGKIKNVLATFLTQSDREVDNAHRLPLVSERNFLSKATSGVIDWKSYLPKHMQEKFVQNHQNGMDLFVSFAQRFNEAMYEIYLRPDAKYANENLFDQLVEYDAEGNPYIEENVSLAMASAAYRYVTERASQMMYNDDKAINRMLGRKDKSPLSVEERQAYRKGVFMGTVANSIGELAVKSLGLRSTKQAGRDILPKLEAAMGLVATRTLIELGTFSHTHIDSSTMKALIEGNDKLTLNEKIAATNQVGTGGRMIIRPTVNRRGELIPATKQLIEVNNKSGHVVTNLFTGSSADVFPSFAPEKFTKQKASGTGMSVPKKLKKILTGKREEAYKLNKEMVDIILPMLGGLDENGNPKDKEAFLKMGGWVHPDEIKKMHVNRRESAEAKNKDLERNLDYFLEFLDMVLSQEQGLDSEFFFSFDYWKNGRVGMEGRFNLQANKMHRYLTHSKEWEVEVKLDDIEKVNTFLHAIAVGFGANADTEHKATSIKLLMDRIQNDEELQKGIDAIQQRLGLKEKTLEDTKINEAIGATVDEGGEKYLSLLALTELAKFLHAQDSGTNVFTSKMVNAIDGVTNGPFLYHILNGIRAGSNPKETITDSLRRGGMFTAADREFKDMSSVVDYRTKAGNKDLYQDFMYNILERLYISYPNIRTEKDSDNTFSRVFAKIYGIFEPFHEGNDIHAITKTGRDFVKNIVSAMVFGSATHNAVRVLSEDFLASFYKYIEKNEEFLSTPEGLAYFKDMIQDIEDVTMLMDGDRGESLDRGYRYNESLKDDLNKLKNIKSYEELLNHEISTSVELFLQDAFSMTIGEFAGDVANKYFESMRKTQQMMVNTTNAVYGLFNAIVRPLLENSYAEYGIKKVNGTYERDFSRDEYNEILGKIHGLVPIINSIWSKDDFINTGIQLLNNTRSDAINPINKVSISSKPTANMQGKKENQKSLTHSTRANLPSHTDPGLSAVSATVHSLDSFISHLAQTVVDALNNHDELLTSFLLADDAAHELNKQTWNAISTYSPQTEALKSFESIVMNIDLAGLEKHVSTDQIAKGVLDYLYSINPLQRNVITVDGGEVRDYVHHLYTTYKRALDTAYITEMNKLLTLRDYEGGIVNQYSSEEGGYEITKEDIERVENQIIAIQKKYGIPEKMLKEQGPFHVFSTALLQPNKEVVQALEAITKAAYQKIKNPRVPLYTYQKYVETLVEPVQSFDPDSPEGLEDFDFIKRSEDVKKGSSQETPPTSPPATPKTAKKYKTELPKTKNSPFGILLDENAIYDDEYYTYSREEINKPLEKYLRNNPDSNAYDLVQEILNNPEIIKEEDNYLIPMITFLRETPNIGNALKNIEVHFITKDTKLEDTPFNSEDGRKFLDEYKRGLGGVFSARRGEINKGKNPNTVGVISLGSPDFLAHGTRLETAVHEILHALTLHYIRTFPDSKEVILLKELLEDAKEQLKEFTDDSDIAYALQNTDEFIAMGMTNKETMYRLFTTPVSEEFRKKHSNNMFFDKLLTFGDWFIDIITRVLVKQSHKNKNYKEGLSLYKALSSITREIIVKSLEVSYDTYGNPQVYKETNGLDIYDNATVEDILNSLDSDSNIETQKNLKEVHELIDKVTVNTTYTEQTSFDFTHNPAPIAEPGYSKLEDDYLPFLGAPPMSFKSSRAQKFTFDMAGTTLATFFEKRKDNPIFRTATYRQLVDLYRYTEKTIKPEHFLPTGLTMKTATKEDIKLAQEKHEDLFRKENNTDFLARFIALGLSNTEVGNVLNIPVEQKEKKDNPTITQRIKQLVEDLFSWINDKATGTNQNQTIKEQLEILAYRLESIQQRHANKLSGENIISNLGYVTDRINSGISNAGKATIQTAAERLSSATKNKKGGIANTIYTVATSIKTGMKNPDFVKNGGMLKSFYNYIDFTRGKEDSRPGFVRNLATHIHGHHKPMEAMVVAANFLQGNRKTIEANAKKFLDSGFKNGGIHLTQTERNTISQVFLRGGTQYLIDDYSMEDIEGFLKDGDKLSKEIQRLSAQLRSSAQNKGHVNAYLKLVSDFAYRSLYGGNSVHAHALNNIGAIARLVGIDPKVARVSEKQAKAVEPTLKKLFSLMAISYMKPEELTVAHRLLQTENARTDGNGIKWTLQFVRDLEKQSKEILFSEDTLGAHMTDAYLPDQLDERTHFEIAPASEASKYKAMGYVMINNPVSTDPSITSGPEKQYMYVLKNSGSNRYVSQAMQITNKHHRGTTVFESNFSNGVKQTYAKRRKDIDSLFKTPFKFENPGNLRRDYAIPLLTSNGLVANYRYEMDNHTKDSLFSRNNDFGTLLGKYAASIYDKVETVNHNQNVADVLISDFKDDYDLYKESFVWVGKDSKDPVLAEYWNLIPEETQNYLKTNMAKANPQLMLKDDNVKDGIFVRKDLLTVTFGYRMPSLAEFLESDPANRNKFTELFVAAVEHIYKTVGTKWLGVDPKDAEAFAKRAIHHIRRGEDVFRTMIQEMKQWIVVKSGVVLLGNIWSNTTLLMMNGMHPIKAITKQIEGYKLLKDYKLRTDQAYDLHTRLSINPDIPAAQRKRMESDLETLRQVLNNNPIQTLIHNGLMPTIVEDVALEDDPYSLRNQFFNKLDEKTSKLPKSVREVAKFVYMAQDTTLFKVLNTATQYSDFVARHALYDHLTNKKHNPLSEKEALDAAKDSFIMYDIAMPRHLQYMDGLGLVLFMKYALGIQRVLASLLVNKPVHVVSTILTNATVGISGLDTVMDSSWLTTNRLTRNPLEWSIFNIPKNVGTIGTIEYGISNLY
ncbi:Uncharacterised protein [Oligella urethralis]|nr:Uncharacterised protein [Oligella urethralis]